MDHTKKVKKAKTSPSSSQPRDKKGDTRADPIVIDDDKGDDSKQADTVTVHVRNGRAWGPIEVPRTNVLVIADGSGYNANRHVYDRLRALGFKLDVVAAGSKHRSFAYPSGWSEPGYPDDTNPDDLGGFGHDVCEAIETTIPAIIICGSRGGQVPLGVVWRRCWRGPVVCINGGVLTANVPVPSQARLVCVTAGRDYFATQDIKFTCSKFAALSSAAGATCTVIHLKKDKHMPKNLDSVMAQAIQLATLSSSPTAIRNTLWPLKNVRVVIGDGTGQVTTVIDN